MENLKKFFLIMILVLGVPCFAKVKLQSSILFSIQNIDGIPFLGPYPPNIQVLYEFPHKNIFSFSLGGGINYVEIFNISAVTEFSWRLKELKKTDLSLVLQLEGGAFPFLTENSNTGYYGLYATSVNSSLMTEWAWRQKRFYLRTGVFLHLFISCEEFERFYTMGFPLTFGWRFGS